MKNKRVILLLLGLLLISAMVSALRGTGRSAGCPGRWRGSGGD